jgi:hypothetical protein
MEPSDPQLVCRPMKHISFCAVSVAGFIMICGCHKAESPATVQADVTKAQAQAAERIAKAQDREDKTADAADDTLEREQTDADNKKADAAADTALAEAEGANKIALARCEAFSGDRQKACKDAADATLETAKEKAKADRAQH